MEVMSLCGSKEYHRTTANAVVISLSSICSYWEKSLFYFFDLENFLRLQISFYYFSGLENFLNHQISNATFKLKNLA